MQPVHMHVKIKSCIHNGYLKKGVPFFRRRATVMKVGTNTAETLPNAPIEWNFPKYAILCQKFYFFWKRPSFQKNDFFVFVQQFWWANVDRVLHTVGKLQLSSFQRRPLEPCVTKGSVRRGQNVRGGQKRYPKK